MSEDCPHCIFEKTEANCRGCFEGSHYRPKPITNADRIRSMTDEELAKIITDDWCEVIHCDGAYDCDGDCEKRVLDWLKQEATE